MKSTYIISHPDGFHKLNEEYTPHEVIEHYFESISNIKKELRKHSALIRYAPYANGKSKFTFRYQGFKSLGNETINTEINPTLEQALKNFLGIEHPATELNQTWKSLWDSLDEDQQTLADQFIEAWKNYKKEK